MASYGPPSRYCGQKQQYVTWDVARQAAKTLERRERLPMKAYRCPACHWYHVAHAVPLKRPRDWRHDNVDS